MLPLLLLYCCCTAACICCYVGCRGCCFLSIAAACCCLPRLPALIPTHPPTHPPNASPRAQADYALDQVEEVAEINRAAARLAKKATAAYMAAHPGERKFVAGAIGPTNKTLSVSPSVENPALRGITYDEVEQAYYEQAKALYEGGVDLFLVETIFDTGNAKAAIYALERFFEEQARGGWGCCALLLLCCCCCCCMPGGWLPVFASSGAAAADAAGGAVAVRRSSSGRQQQAQAQPAVQHPHLCTRAPALTRAPAPPHPTHPTPPPHPTTPPTTGAGRAHPGVHQRHHCGQLWAHAERADQRGVLEQREPRQADGGGPELRAGRHRHEAVHRQPVGVRGLLCVLLPQRGPAQRHGRVRPEGRGDGGGHPALL